MAAEDDHLAQADLDAELVDLLIQTLDDGTDQTRIDLMTRWCLLRLNADIDLKKPPMSES